MLSAIRNSLNSWIVKALFLLLIASFAVWGIGDFVGGGRGTDRSVAHVSGTRVSLAEATDAFQRDLAQMRRSFGGQFEPTGPVREALAEAALGRLVALRALDAEGEARGIVVPDEALRDAVFSAPAFQGADGRFSRAQFQAFLRNNGLTEERFLALLRSDLARGQLIGSVRVGATAPAALAAPVLAFRAERRVADLVELPFIAAPAPPEPTEEQLRRHHENNPDLFTAPEYRAVAFLLLTPDDVAREIDVTESELRAAFAERAADFATPERRSISQAVVQDETLARSVADSWRAGAPLAEIVARVESAGGSAGLLGTFTRETLPLAPLAEAVFALPEAGVSEPVRTPFGWHVVRVESIEAATRRGFEEVREELRSALARERAADLVYARANRVEDSIAEGIPLAEVARRHGLRLIEIAAIDATGRGPDGADIDLQGTPAEALAGAFDAGPGARPRLTEGPDGTFYALRLDGITPPALKPFETVEPEVRASWEAAQRRRAMEEEAAALLAAVRGGSALEEAARRAGWSPRRTPAFTRDGRDPGAPPAPLVQALFALPRGEATMIETAGGFLVASVVEIEPAQPLADPAGLERLRRELSGAIAEDLETQFIQAVREGLPG
ncbi:MAG: SurA N-terminal domain-containing protein, partial [Acetobacteraceae bacterium]